MEPGIGTSRILIELGLLIIGLALITRFANRFRLSAISFYLLAGLAMGTGGVLPLRFTEAFVHTGAEIGALLLLFMLGLEHTGDEISEGLRSGLAPGIVDFVLNFGPGFAVGLLFGWSPLVAFLLGGITYISSSGIAAKVWSELGHNDNPEIPPLLSILVLEDLAMALYLPIIAVLLLNQGITAGLISVGVALTAVLLVLFIAVRFGNTLSKFFKTQSDEAMLFTTFGIVLLVAGAAQRLQISSAIGAFLVGVAVSGPLVGQAKKTITPLRDLFSAFFFFFFGLQIDPSTLPPVLLPAIALGLLTALTKILTGWWATRRSGVDRAGRVRGGLGLVPRGEFSILIAGLGSGLEPALLNFSAAYVLFLAVLGPILLKIADSVDQRKAAKAAGEHLP